MLNEEASRACGLRSFTLLAVSVLAWFSAGCESGAGEPIQVGVLLPPVIDPGPIQWAVDNVNEAGGVAGGRMLELVFAEVEGDSEIENIEEAARPFLEDDAIVAVIGPASSQRMLEIAPAFAEAEKLLISPAAAAEEVFRAWHEDNEHQSGKYIWRTTVPDTFQIESLLVYASEQGHQRVAAVTSSCTPEEERELITTCKDADGQTYLDWFGFLAEEAAMTATAVVRYDQHEEHRQFIEDGVTDFCEPWVELALDSDPELLFAAPSFESATLCIARVAKRLAPEVELFFSDTALFDGLAEDLGSDAEGVQGFAAVGDPDSHFEERYIERSGGIVPNFGADGYDAVLLLAYALEVSDGEGGPALADALKDVVDGRGEEINSWDVDGIEATLRALRNGEQPDVYGATGSLTYDAVGYTDPLEGTFEHWRIESGTVVELEKYPTAATEAAFFRLKDEADALVEGATHALPPIDGLWALLIAGSHGWENYRHQSDVLAHYELLREAGLSDDRIILVIEDDLAFDPLNPTPGEIRHIAGGPNNYNNPQVDIRTSELNLSTLRSIMTEDIGGNMGDNIYVFMAGHADHFGMSLFGAETNRIDGTWFADVVEELQLGGRFRQMFVAVEACFSGLFGVEIERRDILDVLVMTAATPTENSLAMNYDFEGPVWHADQFSFHLANLMLEKPDEVLGDVFLDVHEFVSGSHVQTYNAHNFGNIASVPLSDFVVAP